MTEIVMAAAIVAAMFLLGYFLGSRGLLRKASGTLLYDCSKEDHPARLIFNEPIEALENRKSIVLAVERRMG